MGELLSDYDKPYFAVYVMVENEVGDLFVVYRSNAPFDTLPEAEEAAFRVQHNASLEFDRMDE